MNNYSLFGERLLSERTRLGLSQAEAAATCGVSREMWGKYERGKSSMGTEVLSKFALTGADALYVLTGQRSAAGTVSATAELPPGEQLLLEAYRDLPVAKQKQLLADLLVGNAGKKAARKTGTSINVTGDGNRTAGRNYNENTKEK